DPSGRTVHKVYDEWGRVTDIISPSGDRVHLLYNLTGQVTEKQVFPATGGKYVLSSSAYNAGGQQLWSAGEDGKRTTYTYRQDGKISSVLLPSGHKLVWKYNILGLPTVKILDGKVIVKTDYDFVTALPVRKEDNTGITTWQYSDDGLLQQLIHIGKNKHPDYKLQWKFDQNRRLISTSDISGNKTTTHYDVLGYLKALYYLPANSHNIADLLYKPVYDGFFRISGAYYGSGMQRHIKYDNYGHLQTVSDTLNQQLLSQWSYTYDVNDNITTIHQTVGKSDKGRLNYRYDVRNNLVSMTCSGSIGLPLCPRDTAFSGSNLHDAPVITRQNYTFTPLNRIAQAEEILQDDKQRKTLIKSTHYSYDTKIPLRLQSINVEWNHTIFNHTHFVYDQSGNMLRDGEDNQITYNAFNQVIQVITPSGEHSYYRYDGNGKKIMEQNRLGLRYFFYSGESLINERITGIEKTTHLIGYQRIARTVDGVIQQYYESNYKGDISGILTKDRNSNNQYHLSYRNIYSPYGMSWHQASASSLPFYLQSVHGFDGERTDPATGWQFLGNGHRTYNPRMRYFVSEDPVGDGYAFGSNNPIMNTDPDGNTPKWLRTVGQIMGYAGTLGFSAIPKKWARITGTVLAAGLCAVGAGLLASSYGTSAVIETVTVNAVVGGFSVASTIATNKGLNIAAEIAGGIMVAGIVTSGLLKLGFSAFSAINTNFFAGAAEEFANPVENSDELIIRRIYPNPHITDNYTQMVEQFIIRNSADLDVELTDVRGTSTFSFLDALKKFSHFFGPISSIEHQITYLALDLENEKDLQMLVNDYIQIDRYSVVYFNYQDIEIERFLIVTLEEYHEENLYVPLEEYAARFTTDFASRTVFVNNRDKLLENNFKNNLQRFYKNYFIFISRIKYYGPVFDGTKYPEKIFHPMFVEAVEQMSSQ
ncbi:MAG: hypothetical protein OXD32_09050, partial [Endozoicomonadaceae bacterium]|nr:hypothetical protein [Endozoicomonadaceae bacterium]